MSEILLGCWQLHNSQYIDKTENNTGTVDVNGCILHAIHRVPFVLDGYNFPEKLQISYIQTYTSNHGYRVTQITGYRHSNENRYVYGT